MRFSRLEVGGQMICAGDTHVRKLHKTNIYELLVLRHALPPHAVSHSDVCRPVLVQLTRRESVRVSPL